MQSQSLVLIVAIMSVWLCFITILLFWFYAQSKRIAATGIRESSGNSASVGKPQVSAPRLESGVESEQVLQEPAEGSAIPSVDNSKVSGESQEDGVSSLLGELALEDSDETKVLFVIFSAPSRKVNQRLSKALSVELAEFNSEAGIFSVYGSTPQNPIRIANAFPPGTLPSLSSKEEDAPLVKGVSLMLDKASSNRSYNKLQVNKLAALAKSIARLGGSVIDAKRAELTTQEDFKRFVG